MTNKKLPTVIITGGTSGLGFESARVLALKKWQVIITSRNLEKAKEAANKLNSETKLENVIGKELELASQTSIRQFAKQVINANYALNAIVCNAGITLNGVTQYTEEGIEKVFGVNHLGHFLLSNLLLSSLCEPARIVFVSSGTHLPDHKLARRTGTPAPVYKTARDLAFPENKKGGMSAQALRYTTSKLCNVLCANEMARRLVDKKINYSGKSIGVYSIDPGLMPGTGLSREFPHLLRFIMAAVFTALRPIVDGIRTPEQSAQDIARLVADSRLKGITGTYYDGHKEAAASPVAYELDKALDLWDTSVELVGLTKEESPIA